MSLRIVFMGTPQFSVSTMCALADSDHEIVAAYCQPPRPGGRGMDVKKSWIHQKAEELNIPVFTPLTLKDEDVLRQFNAHHCDIAVVVAYGLILPQPILSAPRLGCINAHASLLPRWRGAAPIQRAIEAGDKNTGVMIMQMEEGLDTGPVILGESIPIDDQMNAGQLHDKLSELTAKLMVDALSRLEAGLVGSKIQSQQGITYAKKITKSETKINWNQQAQTVHNHILAMAPMPGAWCEMKFGDKYSRVKILQSQIVKGEGRPGEILDKDLTISCMNNAIRPIRLQRAGKQPTSLGEFLRGNNVDIDTVLL